MDDHVLVAELLGLRLAEEADIEVVGCVGTCADARARIRGGGADVVLVDHHLPDGTGVDLIRELAPAGGTAFILVTGSSVPDVAVQAVEAGASGFVRKLRAVEMVVQAVRTVANGGTHIPGAVLQDALSARSEPPGRGLTTREFEVLGLLVEGLTPAAIAEHLVLSRNTVRNHVQRVLQKLGVHSQVEAVAVALREGVVEPPAASPP